MTPERGPLPPLPVHPDARLYSDQVPFYSERTLVAMRQAAFDAGYATAEVARLAGQAVAWQYRQDNDAPGANRDWQACGEAYFLGVSNFPDKHPNIEVRALGVIATPSADGTI